MLNGPKRRAAETATRATSVQEDAHAPLLDAIAANPDDPAAWAVYADLLQTGEHPRGELISLMLERERKPSVRLLELQRKQMAKCALDHKHVIAWRRGFASELRIDAPDQIPAALGDPSLRLVDAATLVIADWSEWEPALRAARVPWRRLRVEAKSTIDGAVILACAPSLQSLRIVFETTGTVTWDDARGEALQRLVLVNAGTIESLHKAHVPALAELRLLGGSEVTNELRLSKLWSRVERVVLAGAHVAAAENEDDDDDDDDDDEYDDDEEEVDEDDEEEVEAAAPAPIVHDKHAEDPKVRFGAQVAYPVAAPETEDDRDDYYDPPEQPTTTTFIVVGRPIEPSVLRKLAAGMSIAHLSARIAKVGTMTVLQFFGTYEAELLPYGLAVALHGVLESEPIALVEIDGRRAAGRYLVLADAQARGKDARAEDAVRRALDVALGYDPGTDMMSDLLEELSVTPIDVLLGNGGTDQLTMIDPSTAPLVVPEELELYEDDEDEDEYEEDYDWDDDDSHVGAEPPPVMIVTVPVETSVAGVVPEEEEVDLYYEDVEIEDALSEQPEHEDMWFAFREHWDERAIAVDDEEGEVRWPDPIKKDPDIFEDDIDFEAQVAEPACARHGRLLEYCNGGGCSSLHCPECGGEDFCSSCFAKLVFEAPADQTSRQVPGASPSS